MALSDGQAFNQETPLRKDEIVSSGECGSPQGSSKLLDSRFHGTRRKAIVLCGDQSRAYASGVMPFFLSSSTALGVFSIVSMPIPLSTWAALVNWMSS